MTSDIILYLVLLLVFLCAVQSVQIRSIPPGQKWPGFSFALHLHGAGLFFLPCYNTAPHNCLQCVLPCKCNYTAHATKRRTGLYRRFSCDPSHFTAADTRPTQAAIIPPAPRWSVSQRRSTSSAYQIPTPRPDAVQASTGRPIIIRYIRVRPLLWIHARRCSIQQTMQARRGLDASHARRLEVWHRVSGQGGRSGTLHPAGQSSGRRRGAIGGYRRSSFRAFAR